MRRRPIACLAAAVFLVLSLLPAEFLYSPPKIKKKCEAQVTGQVDRQAQKEKTLQLELTKCKIRSRQQSFEEDKLLVYLSDTGGEYPVGAVLSLSGTIYPMEEPTNPGQFNSRLYYAGRGISYSAYADSAQILSVRPAPVRNYLVKLRKKLTNVYQAVLSDEDSGILEAMLLGEKGNLDAKLKTLYQRNGISHVLAISGLHISLLGLSLYRLLRRMTGSYALAGIPTALFLWGYSWMTGGSVSTVRAALMCLLAAAADLVGRSYDTLTSVGAVALVLMATEPLCVHQSAFLLSFGAVAAIALIQPIFRMYRERMGWLSSSLSISLSVFLVTFPLLLRFFYEYPLYSTILNLLVIPLMSLLLACGLVCGLGGLISFRLAGAAALPCRLILSLYRWAGEKTLCLPGALLKFGSPALWKVLCYYIILCVCLFLLHGEKRRKKYWMKQKPYPFRKRILAGCMGLLLCGIFLLCLRVQAGFETVMLDIGQGDSIYLRSPDGTTFLMDGGSSNVSQVGAYRILPFLKFQGVSTLDYLMISHMDQDHISGVAELVADSRTAGGIRVGHAVLPDLKEKDSAYLETEVLLRDAGIPILYMNSGDRLEGGGISLTCLWPMAGTASEDRNELCLVLLAEYGDFQMLLTGDIGSETEKRLYYAGLLPQVEVLKTAHHGSRHSTSAAFLQKTRPTLSLISCSATNRYGHPGEETLQRLKDAGSYVRITKDCGAIRVWTDGKAVRVKSFTGK